MTETAYKKQISFSSMFQNLPNKNEASSSDFTPLLNNISRKSKAENEQSQKSTVFSKWKQSFNRSRSCYDSQTYLDTDTRVF